MTLKNLPVILIYVGFRLGIKKFEKDKLSETDIKKYEEYYRDILKNYSPAELSYIDKFEILPETDIVATLLSLELKNKLCLGNAIQINNTTKENISNNEKYVLDSIENGKIINLDEAEFITKVKQDSINNGLLKESKIELGKFIRNFILSIIAIPVIICICVMLFDSFTSNPTNVEEWKLAILVLAIAILIYIPFYIITYFNTYIIKTSKNSYVRTKKGEEINKKLEGLKNYLKDFSTIHEKDEKSLTLWEDYLIYSVIFNQNIKIVKNICDKYLNL